MFIFVPDMFLQFFRVNSSQKTEITLKANMWNYLTGTFILDLIPSLCLNHFLREELLILDFLRSVNLARWYRGYMKGVTNFINMLFGMCGKKIVFSKLERLVGY